MRTYAGHSSAAASNALYRRNLAKGQTGLSVAFDLPTQTGYDSDHELARGEVGNVELRDDGDAVDLVAGEDRGGLGRAGGEHEAGDEGQHAHGDELLVEVERTRVPVGGVSMLRI